MVMQRKRVLKYGRSAGLTYAQRDFTQALGTERLTDPGFEVWTSPTNLTNWTEAVGGTSTVNQETVDFHGGANATRYDIDGSNTSASVFQVIANAAGSIAEISGWVKSNPTARTFRFDANTPGIAHTATNSYAQFKDIKRLNSANEPINPVRASATSSSIYLDDMSVKLLTVNTAYNWGVNGDFRHKFTLPASPVAGDRVFLVYRMTAAGQELNNCWIASLKRNDANSAWDFLLDRISAGTITNAINVTGVGTPNQLRVVANGDDHTAYTGVDDIWTQRGTTQTNTTHNTATFINSIVASGFTQVELSARA